MDVDKYGGKWIATRRGEVVAVGSTLQEVETALEGSRYEHEVILTKVPRTGDLAL